MTEQHPITPPRELVLQWYNECPEANEASLPYVATQAARWGADQQLTADAKWLDHNALNEPHLRIPPVGEALKEAMRPKPPSLKEQALQALDHLDKGAELQMDTTEAVDTIRRALEALDD